MVALLSARTSFPLVSWNEKCWIIVSIPGPSCSKLTMSLVNDSLKFTSSDTRIC